MAVGGATVVWIRDLTVGGITNHVDVKYPECFIENFYGNIDACADSVYQALFSPPPPKRAWGRG